MELEGWTTAGIVETVLLDAATAVEDLLLGGTTADEDEAAGTTMELGDGTILLLLGTAEVGTAWLEVALDVLDGVLLVRGAELKVELEDGFAEEVLTTTLLVVEAG